MRRATRSEKTVSSAPVSAAGTIVTPGERTRRRAIGAPTRAMKAIGPAEAVAIAARRDRHQHQGQPGAPDPDAERGRGVGAELEQAQAATEHERHRHQHGEGDADRADVLPPAAVERAGQPHGGALNLVDLGAGDQVVGDGGDGEADADPDQDQAIALHAALPGAQVDQRRCQQAAEQGPGRDLGAAAAHDHDREHRSERGAGVEADDVGRGQWVVGQRLEDRARHGEGGTDQDAGEDARQAQRLDDELGVFAAAAEQGGDDVADRDREVTDADRPAADDHDQRRQHEADADGACVEPHRPMPRPQHAPGDDAPRRLGRRRDRDGGGHSCAIRTRRTRITNAGPPIAAVMMPTWTSEGRATTRPATSQVSSTTGPSTAE